MRVVLEYSGKRDFYEQIDLLFFYQWPHSKLNNHGSYRPLLHYTEIVEALERVFGGESQVQDRVRFIAPALLVDVVSAANLAHFDLNNFSCHLPLFSVAEQLYRYVRCEAVHNADFPLINERFYADGGIAYKSNHAITGEVLFATVQGVIMNLREECVDRELWPHEL